MSSTVRRMVVAAFLLPILSMARAQTVRLANGAPVPGEPVKATSEGLEIRTPRGAQLLPWETLSPATRYRHQPGFREKFSSILAGDAVTFETVEGGAPAAGTGPQPTAPQTASSFAPVVAQVPAPQPAPKPATQTAPPALMPFPEGTFVSAKNAAMFGLMFGSEPKDTLYLGVNLPTERGVRPDKLFIIPGDRSPETPVQSVMPVSRSNGTFFEGMKWSGTRNGHEIEAVIEVQYRGGQSHQFAAVVRLDARKGGVRTRYFLRCPEVTWASAPKSPPVIKVFDQPTIKARFTEGGRKLFAMVKAGVWDILPLQGAVDQQLQFETVDGRGRVSERGRVKAEESALRAKSEAWENEFKKMKGGETYRVKFSINLGELFGLATFEQSVTAVDLK